MDHRDLDLEVRVRPAAAHLALLITTGHVTIVPEGPPAACPGRGCARQTAHRWRPLRDTQPLIGDHDVKSAQDRRVTAHLTLGSLAAAQVLLRQSEYNQRLKKRGAADGSRAAVAG